MNYTHLTLDERYQIACLRMVKMRPVKIAALLKRSLATIGRELRRNAGKHGYEAQQAHALARARMRARANARRIPPGTWAYVQARLRELWSPEQIAGRGRLEGTHRVSHETIYRHVYADKRAGGTLHLGLRCQKLYRIRRDGYRYRRGVIRDGVSISQRPAIVGQRRRFGDWEVDLMHGRERPEVLLTLNERKSRYVLIRHLQSKNSSGVSRAIGQALRPLKPLVHTLTSDRGSEFATHRKVSTGLGLDWFFAHPHSAWERGANENTNGLIRQFFPRTMRFDAIEPEHVALAADMLNSRPRKCLRFRTPNEVFLKQLHSGRDPVALRS